MDRLIEQLEVVSGWLGILQSILDFDGLEHKIQFSTSRGLGRVGLMACLLGVLWGVSGSLLFLLTVNSWGAVLDLASVVSKSRLFMIWQWCFYVWAMCTFHLLEFFNTAIYNPSVTSANSFLVNHSKAYTAAHLIAAAEFFTRFLLFPRTGSLLFCRLGVGLVFISQTIRSLAMMTCGESFNHLIQTSRKENHVLVTHGVYRFLRHPSYVGFYYWSIATQLVLNNFVSAVVFAVASCLFFRRRIPYEEESLLQLFPDGEYAAYSKRTMVGIPFIPDIKHILSDYEEDHASDDGATEADNGVGQEVELSSHLKQT